MSDGDAGQLVELPRKCLGCGQPKKLRSHDAAVRVAAYQICRARTARALRIYRCPGADGWHLTKDSVVSKHRHTQQRKR